MATVEAIVRKQVLWLKSKGYDDKTLQAPGQMAVFAGRLKERLNESFKRGGESPEIWEQGLYGNFGGGKYQMSFDFSYAINGARSDIQLQKMTTSLFDTTHTFSLSKNSLSELPRSVDAFEKMAHKNAQKIWKHFNRVRATQKRKRPRPPKK